MNLKKLRLTKRFFKRYGLYALALFLAVAASTVAVISWDYRLWISGTLLVAAAILHLLDRRQAAIHFDFEHSKALTALLLSEETNADVVALATGQSKEYKNEQTRLHKQIERHGGIAQVLRDMIRDGTIDLDELIKDLDGREVFIIHVAANGPGLKKLNPNTGKFTIEWSRYYPTALKDHLNCVRLPVNSTVFITSEKRMPKRFHTLAALRKFIRTTVQDSFRKEWGDIQAGIQEGTIQGSGKTPALNISSDEALGAGILVSRMALGPRHLMSVNDRVPSKEIVEVLAGIVDLRSVKLNPEQRISLETVVKRQSFDSLVPGLAASQKELLLNIRPSLDEKFGFQKMTDYGRLKPKKLEAELQPCFGLDAKEIAESIVNRAKGINDALTKIG